MGNCFFLKSNNKNREALIDRYDESTELDKYSANYNEYNPQNGENMFYSNNKPKEPNVEQLSINLMLSNRINTLEQNTQENIKSLSDDIHLVYEKLLDYISNHQESSKYGGNSPVSPQASLEGPSRTIFSISL